MNYLNWSIEKIREMVENENKETFRRTNFLWNRNHFNSARNVGHVQKEIRSLGNPTMEEWSEHYFKNVRSREELLRIALHFATVLALENMKVTSDIVFAFVVYRVVIQTYDGFKNEKDAVKWLETKEYPKAQGYFIEESSDSDDRKRGVDYIVKNVYAPGVVALIQVKPRSSIIDESYKNTNLRWVYSACKNALNQIESAKEKYLLPEDIKNAPQYIVVWKNDDKEPAFKVSEDLFLPDQIPDFVKKLSLKS